MREIGSIPSTIGLLSKLTYLNIAGNSLNGVVCYVIIMLLWLKFFTWPGIMPSTLGVLSNLIMVDLDSNSLNGLRYFSD